ncbi:hypothetical protein DPX16_22820 [Anabarilius grahami]|uniref:Uncharacterized protein n=1 Tax=Anabarilius grahami TaxID=495550 RepID=A0A3N0ZAR8_ANAGA|nr:hypothetical protein DPX16_22820 [Anabarilius grahami]
MDGLLRNCATGCRVDEAFTMDDLVDSISADTSGLRCGRVMAPVLGLSWIPAYHICTRPQMLPGPRPWQMTTTAAQTKLKTPMAEQMGLKSTKALLGATTVKPKTPMADLVELETTTADQVNKKFMYDLCGCVEINRKFRYDLCGHVEADRKFRDNLCGCIKANRELRSDLCGCIRADRELRDDLHGRIRADGIQGRPP